MSTILASPLRRLVFIIGWVVFGSFWGSALVSGTPHALVYPSVAAAGAVLSFIAYAALLANHVCTTRVSSPPKHLRVVQDRGKGKGKGKKPPRRRPSPAKPGPSLNKDGKVSVRRRNPRQVPPGGIKGWTGGSPKRRPAGPPPDSYVVVPVAELDPDLAAAGKPVGDAREVPLKRYLRRKRRKEACRVLYLLGLEGPVVAVVGCGVTVMAAVPVVGAYQVTIAGTGLAVVAGLWAASAFIAVAVPVFAVGFAYVQDGVARIGEDPPDADARFAARHAAAVERRRRGALTATERRLENRRARHARHADGSHVPLPTSRLRLPQCFRCTWLRAFVRAQHSPGTAFGVLVVKGALYGAGMVVGYLAVVVFALGAMYGAAADHMLDAVDDGGVKAIVGGFFACFAAFLVIPIAYFFYCGRAARRAAQYETRGHVTTTPAMRKRLHNIFFPPKRRIANMTDRMNAMGAETLRRQGMVVHTITARGEVPPPTNPPPRDVLGLADAAGSKAVPTLVHGEVGARLGAEAAAAAMDVEAAAAEARLGIGNPLPVGEARRGVGLEPSSRRRQLPPLSAEAASVGATVGAPSTVMEPLPPMARVGREAPLPLLHSSPGGRR